MDASPRAGNSTVYAVDAGRRRTIALNWDKFAAQNEAGLAALAGKRLAEAITAFREAIRLNPASVEARYNLAMALYSANELPRAVVAVHSALQLEPRLSAAQRLLARTLGRLDRPAEAIESLRGATRLLPDDPLIWNDLAVALTDFDAPDGVETDRLEQAISGCRRALALRPDYAEAHLNLGLAFMHNGDLAEAVSCYRRALELKPDLVEAHANLGVALLRLGRYEEGWAEYEHRLEYLSLSRRFSKPRWKGERAEGRTILIHGEQGFGDAIQFLRYALLVRQRSGASRVLLEAQPALARLFVQNHGRDLEIVPGVNSGEAALPPFDCHVPLMSLPWVLRLFEPLPMMNAYLNADLDLRQEWRARLGAALAMRVGLAWAGNPEHRSDRRRSLSPGRLLPLLRSPGVQFYSLQMGGANRRAPSLEEAGLIDLTSQISDFAETAAFAAELDLVISVDTAAAHLAGALGRPVWTLLSRQADWRWGLTGEMTRWYPTMRLFRQRESGGWDEVVQRVAAELQILRDRAAGLLQPSAS